MCANWSQIPAAALGSFLSGVPHLSKTSRLAGCSNRVTKLGKIPFGVKEFQTSQTVSNKEAEDYFMVPTVQITAMPWHICVKEEISLFNCSHFGWTEPGWPSRWRWSPGFYQLWKTFSIVCSLSKLDKDDPVGEGGAQEGGDETSVHCEKAASWNPRVAPQLQKQDL